MVQSWLPEWAYAWAWRLGGFHLLVFQQAVLTAVVALAVAACARTGDPVRTGAAAGVAVAIGAPFWAPRPLLVGVLALALTVLVVERRRSPWWLVPIVWVWVNSHGSFPLGLAWLSLVAAGSALDSRSLAAVRTGVARYWIAFAAGLAAAAINPLGPRLLTFALTVGEKSEIFARVVEWKSPDFHQTGSLFSLVFLLLAVVIIARHRTSWADTIPAVAFIGASLVAARNLPMAAVVLAPVLARALSRPADRQAEPSPRPTRARLEWGVAGLLALVALLFGVRLFTVPALDLKGYPVTAVKFLNDEGWLRDGHLAHDDVSGGYLIVRDGPRARVFYDDRFDMYPRSVSTDVIRLTDGDPRSLSILDRRKVETVLWSETAPLTSILDASPAWDRVHRSGGWVVFRRT